MKAVVLTIFSIIQLSLPKDEFSPSLTSAKDKLQLLFKIVEIILPKLLLPGVMGHSMIGAKSISGDLMGFADISLQTSSGSSEQALSCQPLRERSSKFSDLRPYVCNILVAPPYRKRGVAMRLLRECECRAEYWGHHELYLHADTAQLAAVSLYLKARFEPVRTHQGLLFMRKAVDRSRSQSGDVTPSA